MILDAPIIIDGNPVTLVEGEIFVLPEAYADLGVLVTSPIECFCNGEKYILEEGDVIVEGIVLWARIEQEIGEAVRKWLKSHPVHGWKDISRLIKQIREKIVDNIRLRRRKQRGLDKFDPDYEKYERQIQSLKEFIDRYLEDYVLGQLPPLDAKEYRRATNDLRIKGAEMAKLTG